MPDSINQPQSGAPIDPRYPDVPVHYVIRGGGYLAEVASTGAALRLLEYDDPSSGSYRLAESGPVPGRPLRYAGAVLSPWPGGVRDGHFFFDGIEHQLAVTDPDRGVAVHGFSWYRDWGLLSHTTSRVQQMFEVGLHKGWPYRLLLTATHELGPLGLTVTHTATNIGEYHSPFGLGVHPYLRAGEAPLDECSLHLAAGTRVPLDALRGLPHAYSQPVAGTRHDFTTPRSLDGVQLATPFSALDEDVDGLVRHRLTDPSGRGVELWTGPEFGWLYAATAGPDGDPDGAGEERSLALVPATCPPDAFNLGIDVVVLQAGEEWEGRWGLTAIGVAG